MSSNGRIVWATATLLYLGSPLVADSVIFNTGSPNGLIATLSRPASTGKLETETADDFILGQNAIVSGATFTGLLTGGATTANITDVEIELYHVFPIDSTNPPDMQVPSRTNSPSDNEFMAFDSGAGGLSFTTSVVSSSFTAANSVVNGIHAKPNQNTLGEGAVTGEEVTFTIMFSTPFLVGATDHDFFRPEVGLGNAGNFLWLSAPKPIVSGTPFNGDLQAWIRNDGAGTIAPDWLRVGTDIIGGTPAPQYNMTFTLEGTVIPEPRMIVPLAGFLVIGFIALRRRTRPAGV